VAFAKLQAFNVTSAGIWRDEISPPLKARAAIISNPDPPYHP
jgi:hypothetical protein